MANQAMANQNPDHQGAGLAEAEDHALAALDIYEELSQTDPTRVELFRRDTSEYAPLAAPMSLRKASGSGYERL